MTHTQQPVPSGIHLNKWDRPIHNVKFMAYDSRWGAKLTEQQTNALIPGVLEAEAWREAAESINVGGNLTPLAVPYTIGCATGATMVRMHARLAEHAVQERTDDPALLVLFCLFMACEAETDDYPDGWFGHFTATA